MKIVHTAEERGHGQYGWLDTHYSFSFADWYEPTRMGFGALRVINDDVIAPSNGFGAHSHRDMEIITIVMKGTVTHKDSLGNVGTVPAGDVQTMSAGTGVTHSEYNDSPDEPLELFQIWIEPAQRGIPPEYHQRSFDLSKVRDDMACLVSPHGGTGVSINQNAYIHYLDLGAGNTIVYKLHDTDNGVYMLVIDGEVEAGGERLSKRDAIGMTGQAEIPISASLASRAIVIEVPMQ